MELGDKFLRELMQSDLEVMISLHAKGSAKSEAMTKLRTKKTLMESQKLGNNKRWHDLASIWKRLVKS